MTIPTYTPDWAESAAPGDVAYPTSKQAGGYQDVDTMEHDEYNALLQNMGQWINSVRQANGAYVASLKEALDSTPADNDLFVVEAADDEPHGTELAVIASTDDVVCSATNGSHFAWCTVSGGGNYLHIRTDDSATITTSAALGVTPIAMAMNEDAVMILTTTAVYFYDLTATSVANTGAVYTTAVDICATATQFFVTADNNVYPVTYVAATSVTNGTSIYNHGAVIRSICTDGRRLFIAGSSSSGNYARGLLLDGTLLWSSTDTLHLITAAFQLKTDGTYLYSVQNGGSFAVTDCETGTVLDSNSFTISGVTTMYSMVIDDEFIWMAGDTGVFRARKRVILGNESDNTGTTDKDPIHSVTPQITYSGTAKYLAANGRQLFLGGDSDTTNNAGLVLTTARPKTYRYRNTAGMCPNTAPFFPLDLLKG